MADLLGDIANADWDDDDGEPQLDAHDLYMTVFKTSNHETHQESWEQFCSDVKRNPEAEIPFGEYMGEELAESEERLAAGTVIYRARLGFIENEGGERAPWSGGDIGAPPQSKIR
jgi:hypothetical protein